MIIIENKLENKREKTSFSKYCDSIYKYKIDPYFYLSYII